MKYKGYEAVITYEQDINAFHGRVRDIRDIISFEGASVEELEREFHASIDYYLAMCTERGKPQTNPSPARCTSECRQRFTGPPV